MKQIPFNLTGGVSQTITSGIYKSSVSNTIPFNVANQHYCSMIILYDTDSI